MSNQAEEDGDNDLMGFPNVGMDTGQADTGGGGVSTVDNYDYLSHDFNDDDSSGTKDTTLTVVQKVGVKGNESPEIDMDDLIDDLFPETVGASSSAGLNPNALESLLSKESPGQTRYCEGWLQAINPNTNVSCNVSQFDIVTEDTIDFSGENVKPGADKISFNFTGCPGFFHDRRMSTRLFFNGSKDSHKNVGTEMAATFRGGNCYSCEVDIASTHVLVQKQRPVLIVGDNYFPPMIGDQKSCLPVVRVNTGTPQQAQAAILETLNLQHGTYKGKLGDFSDGLLVVVGLNCHLERVGITSYIEDMENLAKSLIEKFSAHSVAVKVGLVHVPVAQEYLKDKPAFARDLAALMNIMKLTVTQSSVNWATALFYQASEFTSANDDIIEAPGVGLRVKQGNVLLGNQLAIQVLPSTLLAVKQGTKDLKPKGCALGSISEYRFVSSLTKDIRSYLNHNNIGIHTPQLRALAHCTAEGIPNLNDGMQTELFAELSSKKGVTW